ncbi:hypothetical protein AVEN_270806-1 [Araneus ventricosus]|uniref:Uncharacterized protein n=1 Tax=Araneus ventricosus TaxID=182803 RepID=A0A4Y2RYP4_ARAVE|nr:hypothetical protein AVEN_270806-1 [Araneus ventricosus]
MPAMYVSHTTVRSVSVTNPVPSQKYARYISKHEYKVEIDFKNSSDEIDGLISTPSESVHISTTPAVKKRKVQKMRTKKMIAINFLQLRACL